MLFRKPFFLLIMFLLLTLMSCDEFLLKKTVSVVFLEGDLKYDPNDVTFSGDLFYTVQNKQNKILQEIYFISHSKILVDSIRYSGELKSFEQGIGYGSGFYRIRIPSLPSGNNAKIEIKFHINGPVNEDRFLLTDEAVFMDAKKIWLPVPFADSPNFLYSIRIKTPENYYTALGAKVKDEIIKDGEKSTLWESESPDVLHTGNIFIGLFGRFQKGNIFIYSVDTNYNALIFDYAAKTIDFLSNRLGNYPYSQVNIVNELFQYKDMEEFIDGEQMANTIQISPELTQTNLIDEGTLSASPLPYIPRKSYSKVFEVISHELSHAYIPNILKFDKKSYIQSESFTEYMAILVMAYFNPEIYDKIIMRNRKDLINLSLANQTDKNLFKYLYGVNLLHSVFRDKKDQYFSYINLLIQKYAYTEIGMDEIYQTATEIYDRTNSNSLDTDSLLLWQDCKLYNMGINYSNVYETNFIKKGFKLTMKRQINIEHNFPIPVEITLTEHYPDRIDTNLIKLEKNSSTNLTLGTNLIRIEAGSPLDGILEKLSGRSIDFGSSPNTGQMIVDSINVFYSSQKVTNKIIKIDGENGQSDEFSTLAYDRDRSRILSPDVRFQFDSISEGTNELYIQAFKLIGGKPYSYVLFQVKKNGKKYIVTGMNDPSF